MTAEIGHFALVLALFVAVAQASLPLIGAHRGDPGWMALAKPTAILQFALVAVAFACLTHVFVTSDFSVVNVVSNSHTDKPLLYKISGVWGNHEGSLLLWVLILAIFGAAVAVFGANLPPALKARVLSIQAMIAVGFYLFMLLTSNPFDRIFPPPLNGRGLNPLLQDPGLAIHPPMLYLGYVGFSMAFSFAIAALIEGRVDAAWARWVRPWTLAAWCFLTGGIALGSWWAYYELGWGGWWFWDPVENASFMPWLAGTALLHSSTVVEKRDTLKGWTILLAIITFSLSLLGTFLVRSGVLTSVHAFATDPTRGVFILALLVIVIGGSLALFAWRGPKLVSTGLFQPVSREGGLLFNNLVMATACAAVLLGTLYPLLLDALGGGKVSVGPPFFNTVLIPLMIPMIAAMAVGPFLSWKRSDLMPALRRLRIALVLTIVAAIVTYAVHGDEPVLGVVALAMAVWLGTGVLTELAERIRLFRSPLSESFRRLGRLPRASWGMTIGHLGLAITIAGMAGAGAWKVESIQVMKPGDKVTVGGYEYRFTGAKAGKGPNYKFVGGQFTVSRHGREITKLTSEKRVYNVSQQPTTEAGIHTTWRGDLYAVIGDAEGSGGAFVTRLYFNPLVVWIWAGTLIMVFAGALSLTDRRHRVGAPHRKSSAVSLPGAQEA
ncbi:MAG: heme lyase CcmF/NrfE family subunit [Rhodospirillaceae bacterium]|jgi:cytochrome c-type biogenesis protein CcmF|nr:heme lyase CcmF/NrfE family subunit [Rhodospirillaceae bacterium]MBT3909870.1 heme lyase CcmF/NrfE family subunit [Rhodospirillaceae bacterium]MBT5296794.1 heme lyase CcmF/NrfE family subunit [Rhodospirillaceae bacterium]MBT6609704.1 heme lyase CcmF/NrfE family subunit [Rhodospirillaceae bacterium]MBT6882719.1 heme lyase CcmF/NrfE family subunit [Rhodospirillaceae bacterium]